VGNAVQNLLSPHLISKNITMKNTELQYCLAFHVAVKLGLLH
jgi:hypothetical protein